MGCDIHSHAEKQVDGRWVHLDVEAFEDRWYGFFGWLANVRNYSGLTPIAAGRGFPEDASAETMRDHFDWGQDAHNAGWVSVEELLAVDYNQIVEDRRMSVSLNQTLRDFLGEDYFATLERLRDAKADRVVFWFDN